VIPTTGTEYNKYMSLNKSKLNAATLRNEMSIANSTINFASAAMHGNYKGISNSIFSAFESATEMAKSAAKIKDLKNTPNKLRTNGGKLNGDISLSNLETKIIYSELPIQLKNQLRTHFMQYGVEYGSKLFNLNEVINSRYYFNFIKAPEVFENINLHVSDMVKEVITKSISIGLTV